MLQTFRPIIGPSPGTAFSPEIKLLEAPFGDGYTQPTPAGLNHMRETLSLKWDGLLYEEMEDIYGFFVRHRGYLPFYYRPFGKGEHLKWTCKEFSRDTDEGIWRIQAKLVQSFTLET